MCKEKFTFLFGHTCNVMVCRKGYKNLKSLHSCNTPKYCQNTSWELLFPLREEEEERCAGVLYFLQLSFTSFTLVLIHIISIVLMKNSVRKKMCPHLVFKLRSFVLFTHCFFPSFINFTNHRLQTSFFSALSLSVIADGKGAAIHYSDSTSSFIMEGDAFQNASLSRDKWNQSKIWSPARPEGCRNSSQHMAGFNWFYTHFEMNEWVLFAVCLKEINATLSSFLLSLFASINE